MNDLEAARLNYPRVTDILTVRTKAVLDTIPAETLAHAADRGSKVHALCEGYAKKLWLPEIDEECKPYFESFKLWWDSHADSVIITELRLYDDDLKVTGQIDILAKTKSGSLVLIDLKTSATESKTWAVQLAAYDHLLKNRGYEVHNCSILKLKKTGCKAKEIAYSSENIIPFWDLFKMELDLFRYYNTKEVKREQDS